MAHFLTCDFLAKLPIDQDRSVFRLEKLKFTFVAYFLYFDRRFLHVIFARNFNQLPKRLRKLVQRENFASWKKIVRGLL